MQSRSLSGTMMECTITVALATLLLLCVPVSGHGYDVEIHIQDPGFNGTLCDFGVGCFKNTSCNISNECFIYTPCNVSDACLSNTYCNTSDACFCSTCFSNTSCYPCFSNTSCYPCFSNTSCYPCFSNTSCYPCFGNTSCYPCFSNTSCYPCFGNTSCYPCFSNTLCYPCFSNTSCNISNVCFSNTSCNISNVCFSNTSCNISNACLNSPTLNVTCNSLDDALEWMHQCPQSVALYLERDTEYTLEVEHNIMNGEHLAILGDNSTISCAPLAGIGFQSSKDVILSHMSLLGCGANHLSTSRDFHHLESFQFLEYRVALHFLLSEAIILEWVTIMDSNGTGLVLLDCTGINTISHSLFSGNVPSDNGSFGGGVIIEFSNCLPGNITCAESKHHGLNITGSHFDFNSCNFTKNNASSGGIMDNHIPRNMKGRMLLGNGGALALFFKGHSYNNKISVSNCNFSHNTAQSGGGLYAVFERSSNNTIEIKDTSNFEYNWCYYTDSQTEAGDGSGGGMHVMFTGDSRVNHVKVSHTSFTGNAAYYGGGLEVFAGAFYNTPHRSDKLFVCECTFEGNTARLGAAIEIYRKPSLTKGYGVKSHLFNCTFINNGGTQTYHNRTVAINTFGTLNIGYGHASISGNTLFTSNQGTAISLLNTIVDFEDNAVVNFTNCSGGNGGAINLQGGASVVYLHENTEFYFLQNRATKKGGAIYVDQSQKHYTGYSYECFIRYNDSSVLPFHWNTTVVFSGNKAGDGLSHSLFAESLLPCVWARDVNSSLEEDLEVTICMWKNWTFENSHCSNEIGTAALNLTVSPTDIQVYPGRPYKLNVTAFDDIRHDVTKHTVFTATSEGRMEYIQNGELTIHKAPNDGNTSIRITLESLNTRTAYTTFNATILNCPPGFVLSSTYECICGKRFAGNIICNASANSATILMGYCMSFSAVSGHPHQQLVGRCPFTLEEQKSGVYVPLRARTPEELESQFCGQFDRTGFLCARCKKGYGISVFSNTFRCIRCSDSSLRLAWNWLLYFAVTLGPITAFFVIVIILHISITTGPANGFVFFSQMFTIPLKVLIIQGGWILVLHNRRFARLLTDILVIPYSIWSFDFTDMYDFSRCLGPELKIVDILVLRYVSALYPLVLVTISFVVLELYARNNRVLVCLSRPLCMCCARMRRKWQGKTSIIDAFATFLILSYVKVIRVCITILTPSQVYDDTGNTVTYTVNYDNQVLYLKSDHAPYFTAALLIMGTFGTFIPLLLMVYPTRFFQHCLNRCRIRSEGLRAFVEAFHGCYKDGRNGTPDRRFFAGLYLVFRIVIFTIFMMSTTYIGMFVMLEIAYVTFLFLMVCLQPYKKPFYNYLDAFFFALMGVIIGLVAYLYTSLPTRRHLPHRVFYLTYTLCFVPLVYMIGYMIYWVTYKSQWARKKLSAIACRDKEVNQDEEDYSEREPTSVTTELEEDPDRLINPHNYEDSTSDEDTYVIPQFASENVGLIRERQPRYGTTAINAVTY